MQIANNTKPRKVAALKSARSFLKLLDSILEANPASITFKYNDDWYVYLPSQQLYIKKAGYFVSRLYYPYGNCFHIYHANIIDEENSDPEDRALCNIARNLSVEGCSNMHDFVHYSCDHPEKFYKLFTYNYGITKSDFAKMIRKDTRFDRDKIEFKPGFVDNEYLYDIIKLWNERKHDMSFIKNVIDIIRCNTYDDTI